MKELQITDNPLSQKALDLIKLEQQKALAANVENRGVDELVSHLTLYEHYLKFAQALGLIKVT